MCRWMLSPCRYCYVLLLDVSQNGKFFIAFIIAVVGNGLYSVGD